MMQPHAKMEPLTFLLGCERSGSTWLANIFDAHEDVELMMEPFAPHARLFPDFPPRHVRVAQSDPAIAELVRHGLESTLAKKYSLSYRPGRAVRLRTLDAALVHGIGRVRRRLGDTTPLWALRWELLNLNHAEIPPALHIRKHWPPAHFVVKELRVNLKVPVLRDAFPAARFVVIVRHPAAQLTSIRKWFEQGRLGELKASLAEFAHQVRTSAELEHYRPWLGTGERDDALVLWWFVNYETLLADLERSNARALVIRHENISAHPESSARALFEFLDLPISPSVEAFVQASSGADPRTSSPVDTFRRSGEHSRDSIRGADRTLGEKLLRVAQGLPCREELRGYFVAD
jgi:hypothetical protein